MTRPGTSRLALLALAILVSFSLTASADVKGSFTRTLKVTGPAEVQVTTGSGDISIREGSGDTVTVIGRISAGTSWLEGGPSPEEKVKRLEAEPPITQNGNMISIGRIEDKDLRRNVSISYEITLPAGTKLDSQTGSGDQYIDANVGPLRAQTGSGNIKVQRVGGEARVSTGSGDVRIDAVKGRLYASTGSGNVEARQVEGGLVAETGSGDVTYEQTSPGDVSAKTGSGNIKLRNVVGGVDAHTGSGDITVDGTPKGGWEIHTGSGNINLDVPQGSQFDVNARSSSGDITINHPMLVQGLIKRNRVQGKVGNGGALLSLETGSGSINIR
ncbi:MAG: DUF4097 family beta strand repeat protein [Acidobacteriales bacterium]|nr:DUF4097 family beta strand repeat protein [Terriglobales bacterium]